jgi:hypothetical protein
MQDDLGQSPKIVVCPSDERSFAASFTNNFDNSHLSYFVGVSANDSYPHSIQVGDRNLGPGDKPARGYGYSPENGQGNDIALATSQPVSWTAKIHSGTDSRGLGNILLGDGSGQMTSSATFRKDWLSHADPTTNWPVGHIPASPSIRLVFP